MSNKSTIISGHDLGVAQSLVVDAIHIRMLEPPCSCKKDEGNSIVVIRVEARY